ncbi:MAG: transposase [Bacteroidetes bacterium]|nr:MAG: transposase [Bacteroidota bacterium]
MPELYKNKYKISSNRLQGYDYASEGAYFITVCTAKHIIEFGEIINNKMGVNKFGEIVNDEWFKSEKIRKEISLGEFCIMPNHIHGIVFKGNPHLPDIENNIPQTFDYKNKFKVQHKNISTFINQFKGACTRKIIKAGNKSFAWQTNFYDHIIRNKKELNIIENYIRKNPENWEDDKLYKSK